MHKIFLWAFLGIVVSLFAGGAIPSEGLVAYYPFNGNFDNEYSKGSE